MTTYIAEVELEFEKTDDTFQLNVLCTDVESGSALNEATVSISGPVEKSDTSDGGYAVFSGIPKGNYTIRGSMGGYKEATAEITESDFIAQ